MLKTLQLSWLIACKRLDSELLIIYQRSERKVTLINTRAHYMHFDIKNRFLISNTNANDLIDTWLINLFVSLSSPRFYVIGLCEKVDTTKGRHSDQLWHENICLLIVNGCLGNWKLYWVIKWHAWDSKSNACGPSTSNFVEFQATARTPIKIFPEPANMTPAISGDKISKYFGSYFE